MYNKNNEVYKRIHNQSNNSDSSDIYDSSSVKNSTVNDESSDVSIEKI